MSSNRQRNIDIRQEKERLDKARHAFNERQAELERATGRLVLEYRGFTSTQQVKQWLERLKEGTD